METLSEKTLGDYVILKQIGHGSLGEVFLAEHLFLKTHHAIKVLPEELTADKAFVQRFEREVAFLAALDHPHIVKVHNVSFAEGRYYLVTDCIVDAMGETTNLAQYLARRETPLLEEEIFRMVYQIASALDYIHQKQSSEGPLIHRGIKLNNILIGQGNNGVHLFISDVGLSRIVGTGLVLNRTYKVIADLLSVQGGLDLDPDKTSHLHGSFLQNFAFLAPEQKLLAAPQTISSKADIYAFGVLVYFLLMGQLPEGFFEMPSQRHGNYQYNWDRLLTQCLQKDPAKRPGSLAALLEQLLPSTKETPQESESGALKPVLKPREIARPEYEADPGAIFQVETTVARYQPKEIEIKEIEPLLTEMVVIQGGTFFRGSNNGARDEMPRHAVHISSFAIDIHPVTNEQFVRFLEAMGGEKDSNNSDIIRLRESRIKRSAGKLNIESGYAKHPVVGVTWYGAVAYAKWVGKRLPTEAEWEIAACGGLEGALYPTGDNIERPQANFFSSDTTAVMSYPPNGYELYDMAGNVYEWCQDWYGYHYYDASVQEPDNPQGPLQGVYRILRGGCWKSLKEDLRCAHRHRNNPGTMNGTYGFRCAADVV